MAVASATRFIKTLIRRSKMAQMVLFAIIVYIIYILVKHEKYSISTSNANNRRPEINAENSEADQNGNVLSLSHGSKKSSKSDVHVNVIITFTNAERNYNLRENFRTTVVSLFRFSSIPVNLHILGDEHSEEVATKILTEVADPAQYTIVSKNLKQLYEEVESIISQMQGFFSYKPGAYYSDAFFFISIISHRVFPNLDKAILLDCDLKFNADLKDLYALFDDFSEDNVIGIATEMQPTYRHILYQYRRENKGTRVGDPPPDGLTGFNSGVVLLNLEKMRQSTLYNSLISENIIKTLVTKYKGFKGHLGDQDFFSLISFDHEQLFYTLPCTWNRQLCEWWKKNGYHEVADQYFACEGHINIYHGNCHTKIPKLDWEK